MSDTIYSKKYVKSIYPEAHIRVIKLKGYFKSRYELRVNRDYRQLPFVDSVYMAEVWVKARMKILDNCLGSEYESLWSSYITNKSIVSVRRKRIGAGRVIRVFITDTYFNFIAKVLGRNEIYVFTKKNYKNIKKV